MALPHQKVRGAKTDDSAADYDDFHDPIAALITIDSITLGPADQSVAYQIAQRVLEGTEKESDVLVGVRQ